MVSVRGSLEAIGQARSGVLSEHNEDLVLEWGTRCWGLAASTRRAYEYQIRMFLEAIGELRVEDLGVGDVKGYLAQYARVCRHYRDFGHGVPRCYQGHDLASCPLLEPLHPCRSREDRPLSTVGKHVDALSHFWCWMHRQGLVGANVPKLVKEEWREATRNEVKDTGEKRLLTRHEIKRILDAAAAKPAWFLVALLVKSGARMEEVQRLRVDPAHYSRREGWLRIPRREGSKRALADHGKANHIIGIDRELQAILNEYLRWRQATMKHHGKTHQVLIVNSYGDPMNRGNSYRTMHEEWLRPMLERAGINNPGHQGPGRVTGHHFRHYFTTTARCRGADLGWIEVMRGCTPPAGHGLYHVVNTATVVEAYQKWCPQIYGLNRPSSYSPAGSNAWLEQGPFPRNANRNQSLGIAYRRQKSWLGNTDR